MESFDILVIILSVMLAIFLLVGILVGVYILKIVRAISSITEKAESIVGNVESASETFRAAAGPAAVMKVVSNIIEQVQKRGDKK